MKFVVALLGVLGGSAIVIGSMIFLAGPDWTARLFAALLAPVMSEPPYGGGLDHINTDTEMRFYAVYWGAYGVFLLRAVWRGMVSPRVVATALLLFFLGGVGRVLSIIASGTPDPLFMFLMWIELGGPVVVGLVYALTLRRG